METTAENIVDLFTERLKKIEERISQAEDEGLRARWEFGREILAERRGKKLLPRGYLDEIAKEIGITRREIGYRMQFANKFLTEPELRNAVAKWPTWHQMTQEGLVEKRRAS